MVEGGKTPVKPAAELSRLGFSIAIFPGGTVRALARALAEYYASLREHGTTAPFGARMLDFGELQQRLGTAELLQLGRDYDG
jgi:2-methylisocitrate lyase-like PEP mutase family enzyme